MNKKELKKKIKNTLLSEKDDLSKKITIMAVITKALEELKVKPVIVGGQAVEFYTSGGYSTMDIDIICETSVKKIHSKLKPLGFKKEGKYWVLNDSNIVIEVPSGPMAGNKNKITEVEVEKGLKAYFIGIEDIIIDRLNRYKYWDVNSDKEWIIGMIYVNYQDIDWEYLCSRAKEEGTLQELKRFKKYAKEND